MNQIGLGLLSSQQKRLHDIEQGRGANFRHAGQEYCVPLLAPLATRTSVTSLQRKRLFQQVGDPSPSTTPPGEEGHSSAGDPAATVWLLLTSTEWRLYWAPVTNHPFKNVRILRTTGTRKRLYYWHKPNSMPRKRCWQSLLHKPWVAIACRYRTTPSQALLLTTQLSDDLILWRHDSHIYLNLKAWLV